MRQTHSGSRAKRAQALAEMAVMVPFLVIGMMGMLDLGRAFYYQIAITNAVREGARFAAEPFYTGLNPSCATPPQNPGGNCTTPSDSDIKAHVMNELNQLAGGTTINVQSSDIQVSPPENQRVNDIIGGSPTTTPTTQYAITVSASFKFNFITPIIGSLIGNPLTINTSSVFRAEY